jgi:hypothetical protein
MFRRLLVEEWQSTLTIISFALFGGVFLVTLLRTLWMPREQVQHLNSLPLNDDTTDEH